VQGLEQPFYHILVDIRDWEELAPEQGTKVPTAYVAEESLSWPAQEGQSWLEKYEDTARVEFRHPFEYLFFLGPDAQGDFVPTTELRAAYNEERQDVHPRSDDSGPDFSGDDGDNDDA
jgi:hypothetical protein